MEIHLLDYEKELSQQQNWAFSLSFLASSMVFEFPTPNMYYLYKFKKKRTETCRTEA